MNARTKTLALLLAALALTLGLVACGGGDDTTAAESGAITSPEMEEENGTAGGKEEADGGKEEADEGGAPEAETGGAEVPTVVVKKGEPVGGVAKLEVDSGDQIRFKVKGDEAEEIHLHGYDVAEEIPAGGGTVEFDLPAEIEGIFEAELEGQGVQILELVVNP